MRPRVATWLAWSLGGLSIAMFVAGVAFTILSLLAAQPSGAGDLGEIAGGLLIFMPFLAFPIVGVLIASR
ncbi:MAG: hypothetical protein ACRDTR_24400, partial [Rubrobacter sp.]